jgi:hypothetical protein
VRILTVKPALKYVLALAEVQDRPDDLHDFARLVHKAIRRDQAVRLTDGRVIGEWVELMPIHDSRIGFGKTKVCDGDGCALREIDVGDLVVGIQFADGVNLDVIKQAEIELRSAGLFVVAQAELTAEVARSVEYVPGTIVAAALRHRMVTLT